MTTVTDEKIAKVTRNLHDIQERILKGSLDPDDLVLVLVHLVGKGSRANNLLKYARANCPQINWVDPTAPKAKRAKAKESEIAPVNLAGFFVSSPEFYVDPNFISRIDLSPCPDDPRELKFLFAPPRNMNDGEIALQAGGRDQLRAKRATPPQLKRELTLALKGESRLFVKGNYYLLYLEGRGGDLCPVRVYWNVGQLRLFCYRFGEGGCWVEGYQVCGN